jgi:hypothetical protein
MARYKRPKKLNLVSLLLALLGLALLYAGVMAGPCYWRRWQVKRVLDDTAMKIYRFRRDPHGATFENARSRAAEQIRGLGVRDPSLRIFIEQSPSEIRVGAEYRELIQHPLVDKVTTLNFKPEARVPVESSPF